MNTLIHAVSDAGLSQTVYQLFHIVNISALVFFLIWYGKKYRLAPKQTLIPLAFVYPVSLLWILFITWIENGFQNFGANNIIRGFIYFPLFAILPAKWVKVDKKVIFDIIGPGFSFLQCVAHLACMFAGCCNGYPSSWGLWNPTLEQITFPIQPLESLVALIVCIVCILYAKKTNYSGNGKVYPLFLILFGSTRFFLEFLRDNDKVLGNISNLALHAALMVVVGTAWLVVMRKKELRPAQGKVRK